MRKEMILERIKKAEETITKKQATITKKEASIQKKIEQLAKQGFTYNPDKRSDCNDLEAMGFDKDTAWHLYWIQADIDTLKEDIRRGRKQIEEKEQKLPEYRKALAEEEQKERILANDIPESMKQAKEQLVEAWTSYDITLRDHMRKAKKNMEYKEFFKKYTYSAYESLNKSDDELRKINEREATVWLLDLYNRVKDITGDITDAAHIHWGGKALNGYIVGNKGTAEVFTIEAGGYNIQRWHLRVLVKAR